jgi:predicted DNA-binding transcriptional regulator AlpA
LHFVFFCDIIIIAVKNDVVKSTANNNYKFLKMEVNFMNVTAATAYSELPTILNANQLAKTLGISRAGAYNLLASKGFPTLHIGNRKLVPKAKLIQWIDENSKGANVYE